MRSPSDHGAPVLIRSMGVHGGERKIAKSEGEATFRRPARGRWPKREPFWCFVGSELWHRGNRGIGPSTKTPGVTVRLPRPSSLTTTTAASAPLPLVVAHRIPTQHPPFHTSLNSYGSYQANCPQVDRRIYLLGKAPRKQLATKAARKTATAGCGFACCAGMLWPCFVVVCCCIFHSDTTRLGRYRRCQEAPSLPARNRRPPVSFVRLLRTSRPTCASSPPPLWPSRRPLRPTSSPSSRTPTWLLSTPSASLSSPRILPSLVVSVARGPKRATYGQTPAWSSL
ncbi:hypothetical protein C2E23DRAFT_69272 [Lenzites betulinus]|nr:hypothetical protein C2E23DRAFT_69272 [Lenzites betulinus]